MSSLSALLAPRRFAGLPLTSWTFGLRNWAAMMLALYVAFWLQLESASSAAVCVGILALPTRGQAVQKAVFRFAGTVIGVVASIVIAGLFNGVRDLFILAFAAWLALCVFAAGLLDGNRAYGAVLSGYTVAIVAVAQIDAPQDVFSSGINRGAAIVIGILAIALVNDLFAAPDTFAQVLRKLEVAHRKVRAFTVEALRRGATDPSEVAALLKEITALHADITTLPAESVSGRARSAAARTAAAAIVREVSAARAVAVTLAAMGPEGDHTRSELLAAFEDLSGERTRALQTSMGSLDTGGLDVGRLVAISAGLVLFEQGSRATLALQDLREGRGSTRGPHLSLYRSREAALRNALRAFLAVVLGSFLFVVTGWPMTSGALLQLAATVGLSATNPDPRGFAAGALIAMPLAIATGGITQFLILDGVDQFPLLVLAMGPTILGASLLIASGNPKLFGIGFLTLVFFPVLLSPSNPQQYNPQTYVYSGFLDILSVIMLFVFLATLLPTNDTMRRAWIKRSALADLRKILRGRGRLDPPAGIFRDADRIGQFGGLRIPHTAERELDLDHLLRLADLSAAARRIRLALADGVLPGQAAPLADEGRAAFAVLDPSRLRQTAKGLLGSTSARSSEHVLCLRRAVAELVFAAALIDRSAAEIAALRERDAA